VYTPRVQLINWLRVGRLGFDSR